MFEESLGFTRVIRNVFEDNKKMNIEFDRRAEEARARYWDAVNLPRKTKKRVRKEAFADYTFYKQLAEPVNFTF